ncbi:MAG: radical SAM protein [Verrucomicrobiota bacterium]
MGFSAEFGDGTPPPRAVLRRFASLLEPASPAGLEAMAAQAQALTRKHFGQTMRLFAPLYLSNECVNNCAYCGFSRDNPILRVTLSVDEVEAEARHLAGQGFRSVLLVAGEHPRFVSEGYVEECLARLRPFIPSLHLELGPMESAPYRPLVTAGAEGLVVYQETYHREAYAELHTAGPKRNFDWRLDCAERAYAAGFRRLGVGALFGLAPWKEEALRLAWHVDHLLRHCWKAFITVSLPRLRPAAGAFAPRHPFGDRELVQTLLALRLCFPQIGLVLSTREPAGLRDGVIPLGITHLSAGSHTEPGGYTGAGADAVRQRGKGPATPMADTNGHANGGCARTNATEQFHIADERPPAEMAARLRSMGLDPVWKDWETTLLVEGS